MTISAFTRLRKALPAVGTYGILIVASVISIFPVLWGISTSLKAKHAIYQVPPQWIPNPPTIEHYRQVMDSMLGYMANSLFVALCTIVFTVVIALHGGYVAARFEFPLKRFILFVILATMMIPGIAILIPLYMMAVHLGAFNTFTVLIIIYGAWQIPMALWLLRGFYDSVPRELEEASTMDGCSRLGSLYRIVLPLITPGLAAVCIVVFIFVWNEFIIALTMTTSDHLRLVTVGIYYYITAYGVEWDKLMAAVSLALLPVVLGFVLLQKGFIRGLTSGAIKG